MPRRPNHNLGNKPLPKDPPCTSRELFDALPHCMLADQRRLQRRIRRTKMRANIGSPIDHAISKLQQEIRDSQALRALREGLRPKITYPEDLPVSARRDEISQTIREHQVVVICGETGSGKTTQLPKVCLELGRGIAGAIAHTQPRRIAARSVAARIAEELAVPLAQQVGCKVRFSDQSSPKTLVKLLTDGMLLAETATDRRLERYDTIIIDEAHERSLNIDFLLGYLKHLLPKRPDLKLIITSATIDPKRFADHFDNAPIIEVSGRTYPVETRFRPLETPLVEPISPGLSQPMERALRSAVDELENHTAKGSGGGSGGGGGGGGILIFFPGEREIRQAHKILRKHCPPQTEILPLYARLSNTEQKRIFAPHKGRRIILATNVAETSLTVPGIRYVIDTGVARISRYSPRKKIQRLPIEPIAQDAANQRAGRCGRTAPGICIRLYDDSEFRARDEHTTPEILRTNLAGALLQMLSLGLGRMEDFPFLDPPRPSMIRDAIQTLEELAAIDHAATLTPLGREIARLPTDPRLARMILAGAEQDCLAEILVIAAALEIQDPRDRPADKQDAADAAHEKWASEDDSSDFLALLRLWRAYHAQREKLGRSALRRWCIAEFLSEARLREWWDTRRQLEQLVRESGLKTSTRKAHPEAIHRALLTGLLSNTAKRTDDRDYAGARGSRFLIHPGSTARGSNPKWLMAAEIAETTRLYARTVAPIQPAWIEDAAAHLIRRAHADPIWDARAGRAQIRERVSLWDLELHKGRLVDLAPIDPTLAREMFIHNALVECDSTLDAPFIRHNAELIEQVKLRQIKERRYDLIADAAALFAFFDARIPKTVATLTDFITWRKQAEHENPHILFLQEQDAQLADSVADETFPDEVQSAGESIELTYVFDPARPDDGPTAKVPVRALQSVEPAKVESVMPGLVKSKVTEAMRALPKALRLQLGPVPNVLSKVLDEITPIKPSFMEDARAAIQHTTGVEVPKAVWNSADLPDHLSLRLNVVDERGKSLGTSRDITALRRKLAHEVRATLSAAQHKDWHKDSITDWSFPDIPDKLVVTLPDASTSRAFPALVDKGEAVSLRLLESRAAARKATLLGVRRLFAIRLTSEFKLRPQDIPSFESMLPRFALLDDPATLAHQLTTLIAQILFMQGVVRGDEIRTLAEFTRRLDLGWNTLLPATEAAAALVNAILAEHHSLALALDTRPLAAADAGQDIRAQLTELLPKGFLTSTPYEWLTHIPRYLRAARLRIEKAARTPEAQSIESTANIAPFADAAKRQREYHEHMGITDPQLDRFRWMIEELRVSLFAQELGTSLPVSPQRLQKQWAKVRQE